MTSDLEFTNDEIWFVGVTARKDETGKYDYLALLERERENQRKLARPYDYQDLIDFLIKEKDVVKIELTRKNNASNLQNRIW